MQHHDDIFCNPVLGGQVTIARAGREQLQVDQVRDVGDVADTELLQPGLHVLTHRDRHISPAIQIQIPLGSLAGVLAGDDLPGRTPTQHQRARQALGVGHIDYGFADRLMRRYHDIRPALLDQRRQSGADLLLFDRLVAPITLDVVGFQMKIRYGKSGDGERLRRIGPAVLVEIASLVGDGSEHMHAVPAARSAMPQQRTGSRRAARHRRIMRDGKKIQRRGSQPVHRALTRAAAGVTGRIFPARVRSAGRRSTVTAPAFSIMSAMKP
jgi:hypothetical protein